MLSKRYELTEVYHRAWLHVPPGLTGPSAMTLTKYLKYKLTSTMYVPFLIGLNE